MYGNIDAVPCLRNKTRPTAISWLNLVLHYTSGTGSRTHSLAAMRCAHNCLECTRTNGRWQQATASTFICGRLEGTETARAQSTLATSRARVNTRAEVHESRCARCSACHPTTSRARALSLGQPLICIHKYGQCHVIIVYYYNYQF